MIGVNTTGHPKKPGKVLRIEREVKSDREQPEVPETHFLIQHPAKNFRIPVIKEGENCEKDPADYDIVKVRYDEVRVVKLPIEGRHAKHHSCQARNEELKKECDAKDHRQFKTNFSAINCGEPVKDFDPGRHRYHQGGDAEKSYPKGSHTDREHVVRPNTGTDEADQDACRHHHGVAENRLAGKDRYHFGDYAEGWQNQDVNFGMSKNPKEMLPENR